MVRTLSQMWGSVELGPDLPSELALILRAMAEHKQEVSDEDKMSQLQETFLGMLAGAPTPSRQSASAKKIKVNHPDPIHPPLLDDSGSIDDSARRRVR